jgi:hypothetical protein
VITHWTLEELRDAVSLQTFYLVTAVKSNRIVVRRLRRKGDNIMACEQKLFAVPTGVTEPRVILFQDDKKFLFKLMPEPNSSLKAAIDDLFDKGKL